MLIAIVSGTQPYPDLGHGSDSHRHLFMLDPPRLQRTVPKLERHWSHTGPLRTSQSESPGSTANHWDSLKALHANYASVLSIYRTSQNISDLPFYQQ